MRWSCWTGFRIGSAGVAIAEQAGIRIVDYYYSIGKFQEASDSATDFLKRYPYSQYVRKAEIRRAESSLGNFRGVLFDFTPLYDARERLAATVDRVSPGGGTGADSGDR